MSDKMEKTIVVSVVRWVSHPMYGKRIKKIRKYHVHNEIKAKKGDLIKIAETKPMSKTKNHIALEKLK